MADAFLLCGWAFTTDKVTKKLRLTGTKKREISLCIKNKTLHLTFLGPEKKVKSVLIRHGKNNRTISCRTKKQSTHRKIGLALSPEVSQKSAYQELVITNMPSHLAFQIALRGIYCSSKTATASETTFHDCQSP